MSCCHIITGLGLDSSQNNLLNLTSHWEVFVPSEQQKKLYLGQMTTCHWKRGPAVNKNINE